MGEDDERETCFPALKLPFLHIPSTPATMDSPDHPSTPPLQTSASVPFRWEEQPGKPRPCSDIVPLPEPKTLDLPPCKFTKTPSPTTVLDGPYNVSRPKFSSFRFFTDGQDSFGSYSPEGTSIDSLLGGKKSGGGGKAKGLFGKFKGGKKVFDGGSCRFSPSSVGICCDSEKSVECGSRVKLNRNGSFSTSHAKPSQSHLWTSIYQGIKHVMQWKSSKKSNKEGRE